MEQKNIELQKCDRGILIKSDWRSDFIVSLHDATYEPVLLCSKNGTDLTCYTNAIDAMFDVDGCKNTKQLPLSSEFTLGYGEYIPSLGQLVIMCRVRKELNEALIACGGSPMPDDFRYWSSTRFNAVLAYNILMFNGMIDFGSVASGTRMFIRPCMDI